MKTSMYSIKDDLMGFGAPFVCDNDAVAMRYFNQVMSSPNSIYENNKSQFNLYFVGSYDTDNAIIEPETRYICSGTDF